MATVDTFASSFVYGGGNTVTFGYQSSLVTSSNSIVINASTSAIAGATGSACYIAPIRTIGTGNVASLLSYNDLTKEIQYASTVTMTGSIAASSYFSNSDRRLKTNIEPFPPVLNRVKQIQPVQFEWKADGKKDYGFIAQQFFQKMDFLNEAHHYHGIEDLKDASGSDLFYSMEYPKITAILCKALQEVAEEGQQMRETIEDLKYRVEALENK